MGVFLVTGETALVSREVGRLVDELVGDDDRAMLVEEFDASDGQGSVSAVTDALGTLPLFSDRRIVVIRNANDLDADGATAVAAALDAKVESTDVVVSATGRLSKTLTDAFKRAGATSVGASVGNRLADRLQWVEGQLIEAGLKVGADGVKFIATWLGGDHGRLQGLIETLRSTYGDGMKLSRADMEVFVGEAGSVAPWDLTDAIDVGDANKALVMLHRMIGPGESHPLQILALLSNRYAQMMRLDGRDVQSAEAAAQILGGKAFTAGKVLDQYKKLGSSKVAQAVSLLAQADVDLRGGKDWPPELVMEVLIARLSRLAGGRGKVTSRR
ncbi:MAG: DNA polymerase III subunit delta [Ilumatobacteraceae bacterium]|jgi:DNA polymerase-3 subunit delta|nr:DNA polymerase III subunit delta [Ilumatobacteraceae bacterium]